MIKFSDENRKQKAINRFWSKVNKTSSCWLWLAGKDWDGYGNFYYSPEKGLNKNIKAHKFAYETEIALVSPELTLDHLCRVPECVNPEHLEVVTRGENVLRGIGLSATNKRKTKCKRGHLFNDTNTQVKQGKYGAVRACRTCGRLEAESRRRKRGAKNIKNITHCPKGHEYNEINSYKRSNRPGWMCRICKRKPNKKVL